MTSRYGKKHCRKIDYLSISKEATLLRRANPLLELTNDSETGFWGILCTKLTGWKNKLKNRKYFHQLYRTGKICNDTESGPTEGNEGIITTAHEHISCNIINSCENKGKENNTENAISEDVNNVKPNEAGEHVANERHNAADQMQDVGYPVDTQALQENRQTEDEGQFGKQKLIEVKEVCKENEHHLMKTRLNRVKIFNPTNIVNRKMDNAVKAPIIYCICNDTYDGKSKMVQCDNCKNWYHYSCLNVPDCIPITEERSVFFCGVRSKCSKKFMFLSVDGKVLIDNGCCANSAIPLSVAEQVADKQKSKWEALLEAIDFTERNSETNSVAALTVQQNVANNETNINLDALSAAISCDEELQDHATNCASLSSTQQDTYSESTNNLDALLAAIAYDKQSDELDNRQQSLSKETVASLFGEEANSELFIRSLPQSASFFINSTDWLAMTDKAIGRRFNRGWTAVIAKGLKQSNPFCVFAFKRHTLTCAVIRKRKSTSPVFSAFGRCTFSSCPVSVHLRGRDNLLVEVKYGGSVHHKIEECHARRISGKERDNLRNILATGQMPFKEYLNRLATKTNAELLSGNCDNMGTTVKVMQKISSESRQIGKEDNNVIKSLQVLKEKMEAQSNVEARLKGFIHGFGLSPLYVYFFLESSVRMWHDLCQKQVVFIDATGGLVEKQNSKELLYYEIIFKHPIPGLAAIPVAGMITDCQTEPRIADFFLNFRHAEKSLFGHSNISQPLQINVDNSWAIILALLRCFNVETLVEYLNRCYNIVSGNANNCDFKKTIIHICLAHTMKSFKKRLLAVYKSNFSFGMYCLSLMANASTLNDLKELILDISILLLSKDVSPAVEVSGKRMELKINSFNVDCELGDISKEQKATSEYVDDLLNTTRSEEDTLLLNTSSLFKQFGDVIVNNARKQVAASEIVSNSEKTTIKVDSTFLNGRYCPELLDYVQKYYFATIPMWTAIMLGDLSRHHSTYCDKTVFEALTGRSNDLVSNRTTGSIEKRFNFLKHVYLPKLRRCRLDVFCNALYNNYKVSHTFAGLQCLKKTPRKVCKRGSQILQESWQKKFKNGNENNVIVGKYQKCPTKSIVVIRRKNKLAERKTHFQTKNIPCSSNPLPCTTKTHEVYSKTKKTELVHNIIPSANIASNTTQSVDLSAKAIHRHVEEKPINDLLKKLTLLKWGGDFFHNGKNISLTNTCTIDNFLFIFAAACSVQPLLCASYKDHCKFCKLLYTVGISGSNGEWNTAKYLWASQALGLSDTDDHVWNLYGSEYDMFVKYLTCFTENSVSISCSACQQVLSSRIVPEVLLRLVIFNNVYIRRKLLINVLFF